MVWGVLMRLVVAIEGATGHKGPIVELGGVGRGIDGERNSALEIEGVGAFFKIGDSGLCCTWPGHCSNGSLMSLLVLLFGETGFAIGLVEINVMVTRDHDFELGVDASQHLQRFLVGAVGVAVVG